MLKCKFCQKDFEYTGGRCRRVYCSESCLASAMKLRRKELWPGWARKNKQRRKQYQHDRSLLPTVRERRIVTQKIWVANNRTHLAAWYRKRRLDEIVRKKDLVRRWTNMFCKKKLQCEKCGSNKYLEFHHERYIKDCKYAITLCRDCHRKL